MRKPLSIAICTTIGFLALTGVVLADQRTTVCRFRERSQSLILSEITVKFDTETEDVTVQDRQITASGNKVVKAKVLQMGTGKDTRFIISYRVDNIPYNRSMAGFVDYKLKVLADGSAFIGTFKMYADERKETARGTCS